MSQSELSGKILKQIEYYFGDINLSKDTFLKTTLSEQDGWLPYEILLKFKRLKELSTNIDVIKKAISESKLIEAGPTGIRRIPTNPAPASLTDALNLHADKALYVKGFPTDATLDELITWFEKVGGPTFDVFCKRLPNKKFKGSTFVTFKESDDANKFMTSSEAVQYKENSLIRKWYKEYLEDKKVERESRAEEKAKKAAAAASRKEAELRARMTFGALLELTGLPKTTGKTTHEEILTEKGDSAKEEKEEETEKNEEATNGSENADEAIETEAIPEEQMHTVCNLKDWLDKKLSSTIQIAWVDIEPAANKAIVRFKETNSAEKALEKLTQAFEDGKIMYKDAQLTGRVISGEEETSFLTKLLATLQSKKRKGGHYGGRGGSRKKYRRFN